jgi:serine/threonine protein kinase
MHPFQQEEKQRKCHRATLSSAVIFKSEGSLLSNRIINKFDKEKILGRGDYGKVFLGEFRNEKVAVKRIKLSKVKRHSRREKLQRLNHPNVVKLLHIEEDPRYRQIKTRNG